MINLLTINNLTATINNEIILKNISLLINLNEIHFLMGPNGSGKSTLSKLLVGYPTYNILKGEILFNGKNLINFSPEVRANEGIFLAFQYPLEISTITTFDFLQIIFNEKQKFLKKKEFDPIQFLNYLTPLLKILKIGKEFLKRNLNQSFSGGEKKRIEILQLLLLKPKLIILDEIDSGLDIDNIKLIYKTILSFKEKDASLLLITHCPMILKYINPDFVHILIKGKLIKTGNKSLIKDIGIKGYNNFNN